MAITAKFQADFTEFSRAVQQAEVKLVSFQTGAGKVSTALSRMTDGFSGRKLIQEATLMEKAIEKAGGVSKLTAAELQQAGAKAAEAAEKMKKLGLEVPPGLKAIADEAKLAGGASESMGVSFGKLVASMVTAQAIISLVKTGFHLLVGVVVDSVKAASEAEKAHVQLNAALRAQGTAIPSVITAFQGYAQALQQTTIFQDDALEGAMALLVQVGNVMPRDMRAALTATTELASGLGIDLTTATMMVAKAAEGNTTGLKKLGVETVDVKGKALDFGKVLDSITDKFGGQAAAVAGTYEGRLIQLGNTWNDVQESIGRVITQNATLLRAFDLINQHIAGTNRELNTNLDLNTLVSASAIGLVRGLSLVVGAVDLVQTGYAGLRIASNEIIQSFTNIGIAALDAATVLLTANKYLFPTTWHASSVALKEVAEASEWLKGAVKGLDLDSKSAVDTSIKWGNALQGLKADTDRLSAELEKTRGKTVALKDATETGTGAWDRNTVSVKAGVDATTQAAAAATKLAAAFEQTKEKMKDLVMWGSSVTKALTDISTMGAHGVGMLADSFQLALEKMQAFTAAAKGVPKFDMSDLFEMGKIAPPKMADIKSTWGSVLQGAGRDFPALLAKSLTGGGGMKGAFDAVGIEIGQGLFGPEGALKGAMSSAKKGLSKVFGDTLGGAFSAAIPAVGALIGPAITALWGGLKRLFGGPSKDELAGRAVVAQIEAQLHGLLTAQQRMEAGGERWKMTVIGVRDAYLATGKTQAQAEAAVQRFWEAQKKGAEATAEAFQPIQDALNLQKAAQDALNDAIGRYKFTTEELGPALANQKLSEQSQQLYKDWQVLTQAGVGIAAIGREMEGSINAFLQTSIKMGTEVDLAMRPMLEDMAKMGLLTDAAGNKITDLDASGLTFSKTMTEGFQSIVDSVKELTETLRRGLGLAIDETVAKIAGFPKDITVGVNYRDSGYTGFRDREDSAAYGSAGGRVTESGIQSFAGGGRVLPWPKSRGTDTVRAMLTPGETVRTAAQEAARQGDGTQTMTVYFQVDGRTLAKAAVPWIPGEVKRYGLA